MRDSRSLFCNSDGLDSWRFDTRPGRISSRYIFKSQPPHVLDPYRHHKYRIPYQVVGFKDGNSLRVELAYALPKYNVSASVADSMVLENGIFLYDERWDAVFEKRSALDLRWPELTSSGYPVVDNLRENHLVFQKAFTLAPGTYNLICELRDAESGSIGTFREQRTFEMADSMLAMSDLLLATQIETQSPFPEDRDDLNVVANPLRTYHRSEPAFIYLELYNLRRDRYGRTAYEISYRIGRPGEKKIDPYLFTAQRLPDNGKPLRTPDVIVTRNHKYEVLHVSEGMRDLEDEIALLMKEMEKDTQGTQTTITSQYEGDREDDFTYLQIDLSHVPAGVHLLSVSVKDMHTGHEAAREALFRVIE